MDYYIYGFAIVILLALIAVIIMQRYYISRYRHQISFLKAVKENSAKEIKWLEDRLESISQYVLVNGDDEAYEHLFSNLKINKRNLAFFDKLQKMAKESKSKYYFKKRYRGSKGIKREVGYVNKENATKFSIYIATRTNSISQS